MQIAIVVRDKIAKLVDASTCIVCGNDDYVVNFDFDEQWDVEGVKTAIFKYGGKYEEVAFTGTQCPVPIVHGTLSVGIGVFAGDLRTSTDAWVRAKKSTLCEKGVHAEPPVDVYHQLVQMINDGKVKGDPGDKGDPGYTPQKGTDYWTPADIDEIKSYVDKAILGGAW